MHTFILPNKSLNSEVGVGIMKQWLGSFPGKFGGCWIQMPRTPLDGINVRPSPRFTARKKKEERSIYQNTSIHIYTSLISFSYPTPIDYEIRTASYAAPRCILCPSVPTIIHVRIRRRVHTVPRPSSTLPCEPLHEPRISAREFLKHVSWA